MSNIQVSTKRHPLKQERQSFDIPQGMTIDQILGSVKMGKALMKQAQVFVDGDRIPQERWKNIIPVEGQSVFIGVLPTGGGGGGNKSILRIILTIAIVAAAAFAGPAAVGFLGLEAGSLAAIAVTVAVSVAVTSIGNLLLNALIPPSKPGLGQSFSQDSPTLSISAARNRINRFGTIPRILGKHKIIPIYGAKPFTELVGNDQYLRLLFVIGYGPVVNTDLKIGDTAIGSFSDVQTVIHEGVAGVVTATTLYTNSVNEVSFSQLELTNAAGAITRTTDAGIDEFSVEIVFNSLVRIAPSGAKQQVTVNVLVEYKLVSEPTVWTTAGTITTTEGTTSVVRNSFRVSGLATDQYDVRLTKTSPDLQSDPQTNDRVFWSKLRSVTNVAPITFPGLSLIEMRIKATDQLNGVVDQFSCVASGKYPNWNGVDWLTVEETSNPASLYRSVLQDNANAEALADARLDLPSIQAFHDFCDTNNYEFNANLDFPSTVEETIKEVCKAGRGSPSQIDGKYGVLIDTTNTTIAQYFTPNNSKDFQSSKTFIKQPHAYRANFINELEGYIQDEQIVYNDGFNSGNATRFEALKFFGQTHPTQVFNNARYFQKVSKFRTENYSFFTDVENLVCTRGSLIRINHDVTEWGLGFGRILSISTSGGDIDQITLDSTVTFDTSGAHVLRVRRIDGTELAGTPFTITDTPAGQTTNILTVAAGTADSEAPALIKGLCMFGLSTLESAELIVAGIKPKGDLGAQIFGFDYTTDVFTSDAVPGFTSNITQDPTIPVPTINSITVKNSDVIINTFGIQFLDLDVNIDIPEGGNQGFIISVLEAQARTVGSTAPFASFTANGDSSLVTISRIPIGTALEIKVRYRTPTSDGIFSSLTNFTVPGVNPVDVVQAVSGLELFGKGHETIFEGNDIKVVWRHSGFHEIDGTDNQFGADGSTPPWFRDYYVRVYNGDGLGSNAVVLRAESILDLFYIYSHEKNFEDHLGSPNREMTIGVVQRGNEGQESSTESRITVSNPAPDALTGISVTASYSTIFIEYDIPNDNDFAGVVAHFSTSGGFTPAESNVGFRGNSGTAIIPDLTPNTEYFLRIGAFDQFGEDGINLSSELSITLPQIDTPDIAAGAITADKILAGTITADKYAELRNSLVYNGEDSLDSSKPFDAPFNIISETTSIIAVRLSFQFLNYRAYSTGVASGGSSTPTSAGGGAATPTSSENTEVGHNHNKTSITNSTSGNLLLYDPGQSRFERGTGGNSTHTTPSGDGHTHTITIFGSGAGNQVVAGTGGGNIGGTASGLVQTNVTEDHTHEIILVDNGGTGTSVFENAGDFRTSGGSSGYTTTDSPSKHTHTVTIANHTHTVTIAAHTHGLSFGITEQTLTSPSVQLFRDNGSGFGSAIATYTTDQLNIDLLSQFSGTGIKKLRFGTANKNMRIAYQLEIKVDITA